MDKTKVLLVEDDPNWLKIFQLLVGEKTHSFFDYLPVSNLSEIFSAIQANEFGLILLDLMLPDSHAINTLQKVSERIKNIPIVIITTLDDEKLMDKAFALGVEDYLVKDKYDAETFIHATRQAIKRFLSRASQLLEQNIEKLADQLKELDSYLEKWQSDH